MARAGTMTDHDAGHEAAPATRGAAARHRLARALGRRSVKVLLGVVALLIGLRIALPFIVLHVLNDRLAHMEGYWGRAQDVDISLLRGAYAIDALRIVKRGSDAPEPFLTIPRTDISVEWGALLDGKIVAEIVMEHPTLNFIVEGGGVEEQTGSENDWRQTVDDMVPLTINRFVIRRGEIHYRDYGNRPEVDLRMDRIALVAHGLSTERQRGEALPARLHMDARVQRSGRLVVDSRLDPFAEEPTFNLSLRLRELPATELNNFLRAYAGVDAEEGTFFLYSQIRARDGRFRGYVRPIAEGLELFRFGEEGSFFDVLGDAIVDTIAEIFTNQGSDPDRFATEVPISGSFQRPEAQTWPAVIEILKNAFVRALRHGFSNRGDWQAVDDDGEPVDREGEEASERSEDRGEPERAEDLADPSP
jgi:hypothetical protein